MINSKGSLDIDLTKNIKIIENGFSPWLESRKYIFIFSKLYCQ